PQSESGPDCDVTLYNPDGKPLASPIQTPGRDVVLAFSSDGQTLAIGFTRRKVLDGGVLLFSITQKRLLDTSVHVRAGGVAALAFGRDGGILAVAHLRYEQRGMMGLG